MTGLPDTNFGKDDYILIGELLVQLEALNYEIGFADHKTGCAGKVLRDARDECRHKLIEAIMRIESHD